MGKYLFLTHMTCLQKYIIWFHFSGGGLIRGIWGNLNMSKIFIIVKMFSEVFGGNFYNLNCVVSHNVMCHVMMICYEYQNMFWVSVLCTFGIFEWNELK
jgi:hypothetical protein